MVFGFLLHDSSDVSIGGVSGERKLSIWGGVLEWHRRCQEALCLLESLLSGGGPLHSFGPPPPPSRDQSKVLGLEHNLAKNGSKSLPCQESIVAV
jgi:hypothetical protein